MNVKKTNTMVVSKQEGGNTKAYNTIENVTLEQVKTFKYLVQTITPDGKNEPEIKVNIASSTLRYQRMYLILTPKKPFMSLRNRLLVCYVFSDILYGCEIWTLTKALIDKIEACERWFIKCLGKISCKQKIKSYVLKQLETEKSLK